MTQPTALRTVPDALALPNPVLTLSCPQAPGIVQAVTQFLYERGFDIDEHHQFDDRHLDVFHLRTSFVGPDDVDIAALERDFADIAARFDMHFTFHPRERQRILVMVSKSGHCLNDLLFRWRAGTLGGEIVAVVSNHEDLRPMAEAAGLPYHVIPVTAETKPQAEDALRALVEEVDADLVVLARYMQVLSDELTRDLEGRAINIHHSFLPGFKGGRPYHQAYDRGVKLIGATAHYVTADLDEGPIIEQEVLRVTHAASPRNLATLGQDVEATALSRAVLWHCEHRVLISGHRTIVFQ
ncbi:formyltetrahydrofolate deformylase [Pseudoclavibacter chungangensis]|uniref:Formyltetrahydrofolate deformylase n=1 Tax=Pseudoclavibacter chungangensis TaxID=587635 RepID=A0A7J5C0C3_9MICO|nr:formyltetrahydrofolate deformylase [Pseudoclavibacter chungangensis]KAB1660341.1 formyltetrahydrofolate deformylase [Pseudoclavibacter chungangensis]NYJ65700.1 formyltetrahydrofolate deformylase [Pseudoclavibacter chungangensis]